MTTAFQSNAFQNNAFQVEGGVTKPKVGWMPEWGSGLRHEQEEVERRLEQQRKRTFREREAEKLLIEAQDRLKKQREARFDRDRFDATLNELHWKIKDLKSEAAKGALRTAVLAIRRAVEVAPDDRLTAALKAAIEARHSSAVVKGAWLAHDFAVALLKKEEEGTELLLPWRDNG